MFSITDIIDYIQCPLKLTYKENQKSDSISSYQELMATVMSRMIKHLILSPTQSDRLLSKKLNLLWADIRGQIVLNLAPQYFLRLLHKVKKLKQDIIDHFDLATPIFLESSRLYTTEHYSVAVPYSLFKSNGTYLAFYVDGTAQKIIGRSYQPIVNNLIYYSVLDHVCGKEKITVNTITAQHLTVDRYPIVPRVELDAILDNLCDAMQYNFNPRPTIDCSLCKSKDICKWKHD